MYAQKFQEISKNSEMSHEWEGERTCSAMRRALDLFVMSNDIIDLNSDIDHGETTNSIVLAARYGGLNVIGYAEACATCIDDCASCVCSAGDVAHDWTSDMVQGILVFFMLKHRYMGVTQMAEMRHFTVQKYKNLTDSYNHAAFTSGRMATFHSNVASLHDDDWKPLYDLVNIPNYSGFGECQHCQIIGTWLLNRCAHRDRRDLVEKEVREFVKERIHLNSALEMKGFWGDLIVLLAGDKFGYEIVAKCSQVVNCIWELLRDAVDNGMVDVEDIRQRGINGYIELIELGRKTRAISEGHILGRAMVGSLTLMADRTDVSVFQRILDAVLEHWEKVVGI